MNANILDIKQYEKIPNFIAIEGPIGVGKTILTKFLAESFGYKALLEETSDNPFLPDFYRNPSQNALATQLFFLFQRSKQLQAIKQRDIFEQRRVSDFLFDKDKLFAKVSLSSEEFKLYDQIYDYLSLDLPTPDMVIYLQAETKTLYRRITSKGVSIEKNISFEYLDLLNETYKEFFFNYDRSPLLIVNSEHLELNSNQKELDLLLHKLLEFFNNKEGSKTYFNPSETLI